MQVFKGHMKWVPGLLMAILLVACGSDSDYTMGSVSEEGMSGNSQTAMTEPMDDASMPAIRVSGSYWIELSPVVVAANSFYAVPMSVAEGGITRITAGEADIAPMPKPSYCASPWLTRICALSPR